MIFIRQGASPSHIGLDYQKYCQKGIFGPTWPRFVKSSNIVKKKKNKPCSLALIISISPRGIPKLKPPNTWVIQILNQSIFKKEILNHFFPHIHTHCASRFTGLVFVVGFFFVLFSFIFWKCPLALKNFPFFQVVDLIAHNAARCLFSPTTFRCVYAYYYGPNHLLLLLWWQISVKWILFFDNGDVPPMK